MKKYTTHFKIDPLEKGYVEAIDLKGAPIVYTLSKASNLIVFPYFATISILLPTSCHYLSTFIYHKIHKWIKFLQYSLDVFATI